eukprot:418881-Pelagomonas_calceolata.AAC.1
MKYRTGRVPSAYIVFLFLFLKAFGKACTTRRYVEVGCLQPVSYSRCYGALVKREEGDSKEEVSGSNPCDRGEVKDALYRWEPMGGSFLNHLAACMMHAAERQA